MIRKAKIADAKDIQRLINYWAKKRKVLDRPLNYVYENIRDFWVCIDKKKVVGCCALHVVGWQNLGEIKSLVIEKKYLHKGIGKKLVGECLGEAKRIGVRNIFALTFIPKFFTKLGFGEIDRTELPHKIWADCVQCLYFPDCKEEAVIMRIAA
ncbi:MAG: N-acetyltransferase [Candidatus Omnitrophota bacterium]|nr:MAG: N-acetyltransferase [Candidatus Omnitrophota bacterium]